MFLYIIIFFCISLFSLLSTIVLIKLITIMNNSKLDAFTKAFAQMLPIKTIYHCHVSNAGWYICVHLMTSIWNRSMGMNNTHYFYQWGLYECCIKINTTIGWSLFAKKLRIHIFVKNDIFDGKTWKFLNVFHRKFRIFQLKRTRRFSYKSFMHGRY